MIIIGIVLSLAIILLGLFKYKTKASYLDKIVKIYLQSINKPIKIFISKDK